MHSEIQESLIKSLKLDEGFRGLPYDDHLGHLTLGYGTLLPISHREAETLLRGRLAQFESELIDRLYDEDILFNGLPPGAQFALLSMAYQIGVPKLMGFKKMLAAIKTGSWLTAYDEALDSRWAKQTPKRALRVAEWLKCGRIDHRTEKVVL